jgi:hypothetical protein
MHRGAAAKVSTPHLPCAVAAHQSLSCLVALQPCYEELQRPQAAYRVLYGCRYLECAWRRPHARGAPGPKFQPRIAIRSGSSPEFILSGGFAALL